MENLINQFPYEARKERKPVVHTDHGVDNPEFTKRFWTGFRDAVLIAILFVAGMAAAVIMYVTGNGNAD